VTFEIGIIDLGENRAPDVVERSTARVHACVLDGEAAWRARPEHSQTPGGR
jgi:hypothetical protein